MPEMIAVAEALALVDRHVKPGPVQFLPLVQARGYVLAENLACPLPLPPFRQSSMDGYALRLESGRSRWEITLELPAGSAPPTGLPSGEAHRVFTGAPVATDANCVIMQERVRVEEDAEGRSWLIPESDALKPGAFIREAGSSIAQGAEALPKGHRLGPGSIALLASMGMTEVPVHRAPTVDILASGDELVEPGEPLGPGQIYQSNTQTLETAVAEFGLPVVHTACLPDNPETLTEAVTQALGRSDVLMLTGGISVGAYDFVGKALRDAGVQEVFYKVRQKPGKPLFFGTWTKPDGGQGLVFALPGNPASSLVCYYLYARRAIRHMLGHTEHGLTPLQAPMAHPLVKKAPRAAYERAWYDGKTVRSLAGQESYMLSSLAKANALLALPEGVVDLAEGDLAEVLLLP